MRKRRSSSAVALVAGLSATAIACGAGPSPVAPSVGGGGLGGSSALSATAEGTVMSAAKGPAGKGNGGFDEFGYNYGARAFNGAADGVDRVLDGLFWGGFPQYAADKLQMKWNAEWDRGNAEGWSDPNGYHGAWTDNQWNGRFPGGSGETWHYKIRWVGACGADGTPFADGGYCIWGQFQVTLSHGTVVNQHFWDTHAKAGGYGAPIP